eukprot:CAMPEP_0117555578 /NCGR_PEP_ID=MMETSP0784-20121206/51346_1 /TAXON_ID=39447 /ORGANISM="" /LENGTH=179 /DNA_ID=CAMNT_0005352787 /DNA_START=57 /DNA_END=593 /DNA_ORIENTATION=+
MPSAPSVVPAALALSLCLLPFAAVADGDQGQQVHEAYTSTTVMDFASQTHEPSSTAVPELRSALRGVSTADWQAELLQYVNDARAQAGAPSVCLNEKLNVAAQQQSDSGVYAHTWKYINDLGYEWTMLGQNIARGQTSVQSVFSAWYNEEPPMDFHRRNILNPAFNQMGVGWAQSDNYW